MIVTRSARKFSLIAIDQSHEQTNKLIKGSGGAVCDDDPIFDHHEQSPTFQKNFRTKVNNLYNKVLHYGNPFGINHPEG